jgi:hypothetical protein
MDLIRKLLEQQEFATQEFTLLGSRNWSGRAVFDLRD